MKVNNLWAVFLDSFRHNIPYCLKAVILLLIVLGHFQGGYIIVTKKSRSDNIVVRGQQGLHPAQKLSWLELSAWSVSHLAQSKFPITE